MRMSTEKLDFITICGKMDEYDNFEREFLSNKKAQVKKEKDYAGQDRSIDTQQY